MMADSLDSVRRSMDSLNMCNTPDSLGGEEGRSTQEQLEQVLERATTIQSQVLESIVGVESEEMEAVKTDMAEVVEQEKTMITNDMKEIVESEERDKSVEVEVAELEVVEEIVEAGQKKGIVGLKEVLEKTESTEAETIEEEELVQTSENGITGLKEILEAPIKKEAAEDKVELIGEIDEVAPTPAEIIDINGNSDGGEAEKNDDEMKAMSGPTAAAQNGVIQDQAQLCL